MFSVLSHFRAEFYLSLSDVQRICPPNTVLNNSKQTCQLQIRIGERLPGMSELSEVSLQPIQMWINSKQLPVNDIKSHLNVNAIDYLHLNTVNCNTIKVIWPPFLKTYYMAVYLVDIISIEEMVENIKMDNDRFSLPLNTKQTIKEFLRKSDKDLELAPYKLTLLCPINKLRMKLPAKSVKCNHIQCFDLQAFISLNKVEPTWVCPICKNPCLLADLKVDSFLLFIINSLKVSKDCVEIELYANGKWKPCILFSDGSEGVQSSSACTASDKTILEFNLGNSDDENDGDIVKSVLPITNAGNSNNLKPNICTDTTTHTKQIEENSPPTKIIKKEDTID